MINGIRLSGMYRGAYLLVNSGMIHESGYAFTELTGYAKSEIHLKNISDVFQVLLGRSFSMCELESKGFVNAFLFTKSHDAIEVTVSYLPEKDSGQKLYTLRRKLNHILDSEKFILDKLLNENNVGVGLFSSPDFRLLKANQRYLDYLDDRYQGTSFLGKCPEEIIREYKGSSLEHQLNSILENGQMLNWNEIRTISGEGIERFWNCSLTPVLEGGKVLYIISVLSDVTDNVLRRKHMEEQNEELTKMIEMKDEYLMLISHELKTPLSVITSSIQALEIICKNELSEKVKKYINKIRQNAYQQLKLVNNILDNTRVDSGYFRLNKTHVDIVQLTKLIIETIMVFAERKGIKLTFSSTIEQAVLETDIELYERILLNLLSNAVKYTPEGKEVNVKIFQTVLNGIENVCIQVKDTGIGIPNDKKDLIFERFGRVDKLFGRYTGSTGIGLYLVKMLVSLMDGEINLESKEGVGSTFSIFFPLTCSRKSKKQAFFPDNLNEQLTNATTIEFSDIHYGT